MTRPSAPSGNAAAQRRGFWLRTLHQWHWISSALCLVCLVLFSVTGITLNHPGAIGAEPEITTREAVLPPPVRAAIADLPQMWWRTSPWRV